MQPIPLAPNLSNDQSEQVDAALKLLQDAFRCAADVGHDLWDFAVEIDQLTNAGASLSELRWLVCKGLADHAEELTSADDSSRRFRSSGPLNFGRRTCFVLGSGNRTSCRPLMDKGACDPTESVLPSWNAERHELLFDDKLVKRFRLQAVNQETVLTAFEEEGWPPHLDDPLRPEAEIDPKRRLHDTIKCLNRNQVNPLIRFRGDGSGEGVTWEATSSNPAKRDQGTERS